MTKKSYSALTAAMEMTAKENGLFEKPRNEYQIVQCRVVWIAAIMHLDSSGNMVTRTQIVGHYPSKSEAEKAIMDNGLFPAPDNSIYPFISKEGFSYGTVTRTLKEIRLANV